MPDITMCCAEKCPVRHLCYRSTATPSEYRQSYFREPFDAVERTCSYFWFNGKLPKLKELKGAVSQDLLDQMQT